MNSTSYEFINLHLSSTLNSEPYNLNGYLKTYPLDTLTPFYYMLLTN